MIEYCDLLRAHTWLSLQTQLAFTVRDVFRFSTKGVKKKTDHKAHNAKQAHKNTDAEN